MPPGLQLMEGQLKHRRAMAGQGPAAQPAAVAVLVDADHLEELGVGAGRIQGLGDPDGSGRELDAVALVKVHDRAATRGNGDFLSISTVPWGPAGARYGIRDAERPSGTPGWSLPPPGEQGGAGGLGMASPWFVDVAIARESPTGGYEHCAADRRRKIGVRESDCIGLIVIKAIKLCELILCMTCSIHC